MTRKRKPTILQMRQHIERLTSTHEINVIPIRGLHSAHAIRERDGGSDEIAIAPVRSEISYAIALHEIGHIRGRYQDSRRSMTRERWAWQWARENALVWTARMERDARYSLKIASRRPFMIVPGVLTET